VNQMNQNQDFEQKLYQTVKKMSEAADRFRKERDIQNKSSKEHTNERNMLNLKVKRLISDVKELKEIRDSCNLEVRRAKEIRSAADVDVRRIKKLLEQNDIDKTEVKGNSGGTISEQLQKALEAQQKAHEEVEYSSKQSQTAHNEMMEINNKVNHLRNEAESHHRNLRRSKKEADSFHRQFIIALRCKNSSKDIVRAMSLTNVETSDEQNIEPPVHITQYESIPIDAPSLDDDFDRLGL
jgi:uncharacterized coiled-coil DUF342 family protein